MRDHNIAAALLAHPIRAIEALQTRERKIGRERLERLQGLTRLGYWSEVALGASRVVESMLRKRLQAAGMRLAEGDAFGRMLRSAQSAGIFPSLPKRLTGSESVWVALILRNWEAHATLWTSDANERRGTQAIALMRCAIEALFPAPQSIWLPLSTQNELPARWVDLSPQSLVGAMRRSAIRDSLLPQIDDIIEHVVRHGGLGTIRTLAKRLSDIGIPPSHLKWPITEHFDYLTERAARTPINGLIQFCTLLRSIELREHAYVFAILLPLDAHILIDRIRRSGVAAAFYISECYHAERAVFGKRLAKLSSEPTLIPLFWGELLKRNSNIGNIAGVLAAMSTPVRLAILRQMPTRELMALIPQAKVSDLFKIIRTLSGSFDEVPDAKELGALAIAEFTSRTTCDDVPDLKHAAHVFWRMRLIDTDVATSVLETILRAAAFLSEYRYKHVAELNNILWDCIALAPRVHALALSTAVKYLASDSPTDASTFWPVACIAGIVAAFGEGGRSIAVKHSDIVVAAALAVPENANIWQVSLVAIACASATHLPDALAVALRRLLEDAPIPLTEPSAHVLSHATKIVATV